MSEAATGVAILEVAITEGLTVEVVRAREVRATARVAGGREKVAAG